MTLAIAIRARDGLVMASDSRMTTQAPNQPPSFVDFSDKFLQVNRDVGVMTYGLAVPGFAGINRLVREASSRRADFATYPQIELQASDLFRDEWQSFQQNNPQAAGVVGFIMGGYDMVESNQFRVTSYTNDDNFTARPAPQPVFLAAMWHLSEYLADTLYSDQMTVSTASELGALMLAATMSATPGVGGPIQMATITQAEGFQRVHEEAVIGMLRQNERRFSVLRRGYLLQFQGLYKEMK